MEWTDQISNLNWWAVLAATVSSFAVGFVWYAWGVFGERWAKHVGLSKKDMEKSDNMGQTFLMTGVASFVGSAVLGALMLTTGTTGWSDGLVFGAIIGFAFRFAAHVIHNGFARRSNELTWIDGAHDVVAVAVAGLILGIWG